MKKTLIILLLSILVSACSKSDDNGIDCRLFDPEFPSLYIKIVDDKENNLIETGTINPDSISVEGSFSGANFLYIPAYESLPPDSEIRKYDNTLSLYIPREENFTYRIHINDSTSFNLDFKAKFTEIPCGLSYYLPTEVSSEGENLEIIREEFELSSLVEVEL